MNNYVFSYLLINMSVDNKRTQKRKKLTTATDGRSVQDKVNKDTGGVFRLVFFSEFKICWGFFWVFFFFKYNIGL